MIQPTTGKKKVVLFRDYEDRNTTGARLALQTDHQIGETQTLDTLQTKDGEIILPGGLATRITISAVVSNDEVNAMLRRAVREGRLLEIWEADLSQPEGDGPDTKYPAQYGTGYLASWTTPNPATGFSTLSTEFYVIGKLVEGQVTLGPAESDEIAAAFVDITPVEDGAG